MHRGTLSRFRGMEHRTSEELTAALEEIRRSPAAVGVLELIVRRPAEGEREELDEGVLDLEEGLVGDRWHAAERPNPDAQLTLMNVRAAEAIAGARERRSLAGDQLYVDLDLSEDNLPPGSRIAIGETVVEVTAEPHTGCGKFSARFGSDAIKFVNKPPGREMRLRGVNARIVEAGTIRVGDTVAKL
jgi:MOSC domain-containing protein YiiM